jgi:hypothetical protein
MRRRRLAAGVAASLGAPAYVACYFLHVCMCGHAQHGPYPFWHVTVDTWWIGCFVCTAVLAFSLRCRQRLALLLLPPLLIACRLALGGLDLVELAALVGLLWCAVGALRQQEPRQPADPDAAPAARSRRPKDDLAG